MSVEQIETDLYISASIPEETRFLFNLKDDLVMPVKSRKYDGNIVTFSSDLEEGHIIYVPKLLSEVSNLSICKSVMLMLLVEQLDCRYETNPQEINGDSDKQIAQFKLFQWAVMDLIATSLLFDIRKYPYIDTSPHAESLFLLSEDTFENRIYSAYHRFKMATQFGEKLDIGSGLEHEISRKMFPLLTPELDTFQAAYNELLEAFGCDFRIHVHRKDNGFNLSWWLLPPKQ
jgi:hypothetical protein